MDKQLFIGLLLHMKNINMTPLHITFKTHKTKNGNGTGRFPQHGHQRLEPISQAT